LRAGPNRHAGIGPYPGLPELGQPGDGLRRGGISAGGGCCPLHVVLEPIRGIDHGEDACLVDRDGGGKGLPVQAQPAGCVGAALDDDLGRDIPSQTHIHRSAIHPAGQILTDVDHAAVIQVQAGIDLPRAVGPVPGTVLLLELAVLRCSASAPTAPAGQCEAERGVPRRLAGFVGTDDHRHPGAQVQGRIAERPEGARGHPLHPHRSESLEVPAPVEGTQAGRDHAPPLVRVGELCRRQPHELASDRGLRANGVEVVSDAC